ncbi:MAG: HAMP domain-containing protein [Ignavibacteria bacterium]|nr:HAMP domain-containing protein [Ignavibacteria bacterium]
MKFTLRARLALMYGALVAVTLIAFAAIAYVTVSSELYQNLDASLSRAGSSLLAVLRKEQAQARKPLVPVKKTRRATREKDLFSVLQQTSVRDFVGPVATTESAEAEQDPVWSAVYEHMLLNSSNYVMQVVDKKGAVAWRSDNLIADSLPPFQWFAEQGAPVVDDRIYTYYWLRGERYRLVLTRGDVADVTAAYPAAEVDITLRRLFSLMLYSLPVALILSVGMGWFIAGRSLRPVDVITRSARQITASNLGLRLPVPPSDDEIARLTETLNDMIARLETSFAQIRQFTSDASHELKTPLAILMGELEVALRRPMREDEYRATLASCLEEVERLTQVVQGLLELSRAETGQVTIDRAPIRFSALVADVCDDVMLMAETKRIDVTTHIEPNISVTGDRVRLHQALLNVIENAVKYTPANGSVRVELGVVDGRARLVVADSGMGIPADQLPFIYDRFFRVDKARSKNIHGTGLGLSIVKWIVDAHDGTIEAMSAEGKGTTVIVTFPLREASEV